MKLVTVMDAIVAMDNAKKSLYRYEADSYESRARLADALVRASILLRDSVAHLTVEIEK
tara:strand:+ start:369 stop:545 length:177 start_codon:yes stop_codon:yes gene_type:complete